MSFSWKWWSLCYLITQRALPVSECYFVWRRILHTAVQTSKCFDWWTLEKMYWLGGKWLWKLSIDVAAALFQDELEILQNKQKIRVHDILIKDVKMEKEKRPLMLHFKISKAPLCVCTNFSWAFYVVYIHHVPFWNLRVHFFVKTFSLSITIRYSNGSCFLQGQFFSIFVFLCYLKYMLCLFVCRIAPSMRFAHW